MKSLRHPTKISKRLGEGLIFFNNLLYKLDVIKFLFIPENFPLSPPDVISLAIIFYK